MAVDTHRTGLFIKAPLHFSVHRIHSVVDLIFVRRSTAHFAHSTVIIFVVEIALPYLPPTLLDKKSFSSINMLMNYHEMTMGQPRNSESNRRQYLVICTVMATAFAWSVLQAGGLAPVVVEPGTFPGGRLVYKYTQRDYAASKSLSEQITKDAGLRFYNETIDRVFALYLDDPQLMSGRRQRFACGLLDSSSSAAASSEAENTEDNSSNSSSDDVAKRQEKMLETNVGRVPPTKQELEEDGAFKLWPKLEYKQVQLPTTKALVVQFPYTNGFVSAIIFGFKVLPALRQAAVEAGADVPVVLSTCSEKESMCTHYAPLESARTFLLGQPDTDTYLQALGPEPMIGFMAALTKMKRRAAGWLGMSDTATTTEDAKEEL